MRSAGMLMVTCCVILLLAPPFCEFAGGRTSSLTEFSGGGSSAGVIIPSGGGWNNSTSIRLPRGSVVQNASLDVACMPGEELVELESDAGRLAASASLCGTRLYGDGLGLADSGWWWSEELGPSAQGVVHHGTVLSADGLGLGTAACGLWSPRAPAPVARFDSTAVWDPDGRQMILFGGWSWVSSSLSLIDFYSPENGSWSEKAAGIPPRSDHSAIWDPENDRMLVFGGYIYRSSITDELWAYYPSSNTWEKKASAPGARGGHAAVWDGLHHRMLVYGGNIPGNISSELLAYFPSNDTWVSLGNGTAPPITQHTAVWDDIANRLVLFGGVDPDGKLSNDTWTYDPATEGWSRSAGAPPPRQMGSAVWDPDSGRMLVFGGAGATQSLNDLWAYDPRAGTWTRLMSGASIRQRHAAIWEPAGDQMMVFGGWSQFYSGDDLWTYHMLHRTQGSAESRVIPVGDGRNATLWANITLPRGGSYDVSVISGQGPGTVLEAGLQNGDHVLIPGNINTVRLRIALETMDANDTPVLHGWGLGTRAADSLMHLAGGAAKNSSVRDGLQLMPESIESWDLLAEGPSARYGHSAVWDPDNGQMLVFGGYSKGAYSGELWAYLPRVNTWLRKSGGPPGRMLHSAVWNPDDGTMMVFGGFNGGILGELWVYSPLQDSWTSKGWPPVSARYRHCAVWDPDGHQMLVFGGTTGGGSNLYSRDLLAYRPSDGKWTYKATVNNARHSASAVWEPQARRMLVFGGVASGGLLMNDLWSYYPSNDTWCSRESPVRARFGHAAVYDGGAGEMLVFGGNTSVPCGELWAYSCSADRWTAKKACPSPLHYHSAVLDEHTGLLLEYGGLGADAAGDLWAHSFTAEEWTRKAEAPGGAYRYSAVWDTRDSQMLVFVGNPPNGTREVWSYSPSGDNWSRKNTASGPSARYFYSAVWDTGRSRMLVFGGSDGLKCLDDLWAYYPSTGNWSQLGDGPPARMGAAAVWNSREDEMLLYGGQTADVRNGTLGDVWAYVPAYDQWVQKVNSSTARAFAATAWDEARQRMLVFGGSSMSNGNETLQNDLWSYSWADNRWTLLGSGASPRKGSSAVWDAGSDRLLLFGGESNGTYLDGLWTYCSLNRSWSRRPGGPSARAYCSAVWDQESAQVLVLGGRDDRLAYRDLWSYGPVFDSQGSYVSPARDLGIPASLGPVGWAASQPPGTGVNVSIRSSADGLAWSPWEEVADGAIPAATPARRCVQWRAELRSPQNTSTPVLSHFFLNYTDFVQSGEIRIENLSASGRILRAAVHLNATPNNGSLAIQVSCDGGARWQAVADGADHQFPAGTDRFDVRVLFDRSPDGASPALHDLRVDYWRESVPRGIELQVGNGTLDLAGNATRAPLEGLLNRFLSEMPSGGPDEVVIPICVYSASACRVNLSGLRVIYECNRPPYVRLAGPADNYIFHGRSILLSWEGTDPDGDAISYGLLYSDRPWLEGPPTVVRTDAPRFELANLSMNRDYFWTVAPTDGFANGTAPEPRRFSTVNIAPRVTSVPSAEAVAGRQFAYCVTAVDDDSDPLAYILETGPPGMSLNSTTGMLRWTPAPSQLGNNQVLLAVTDGFGGEARQVFSVNVVPDQARPLCTITSPRDGAWAGRHLRISGTAVPGSAQILGVQVRLDSGEWKNASGTDSWSCTIDTGSLNAGMHLLEARAFDGRLYSDIASVSIRVDGASPANAGGALLWALPAIILLTGAGLAAAAYSIRKRSAGPAGGAMEHGAPVPPGPDLTEAAVQPPAAEDEQIQVLEMAHEGEAEGAGFRGVATAGLAKTNAAAPPVQDMFLVEDVFLMYKDGRLIQHNTRRLKADLDLEVMTSMLRAVQIFVRESLGLGDSSELGSMEYGDNKILLQKGKYVILAVVVSGAEPADFRDEIKGVINDIEGEYEFVLAEWNGVTADMAGAKKFLNRLGMHRTWEAPVIRPQAVISIASELEFFQGFVRVKVAVKNSMATVVRHSALRVLFNDTVLRLDHIEPEYPVEGREIVLGDIEPHEKRTVALFLDPQICTESYLEGLFVFKDARGQLDTMKMPRKLVSVVCPIMYTEHNINVAMLKRMVVEELDKKDSKVFSLPPHLSAEDAFYIGKAAVERHDMRLVRDFIQREPYVAEAWYFGAVKGRPDKLVTRVRALGERRVLEFHVACSSTLMLTGMLAELKADLNHELEARKGETLRQVTAPEELAAVTQLKSLLDKMAESEGRPGETEPRPPGS